MTTFFKKHLAIVLGGLVLTTLISSPLIAFPWRAGETYKGININHGFNDHEYLMRGKDALEGHGLGNPAMREGKDRPDYYFTINEYILVFPVRALGLSDSINIATLYGIYNFIGVFLLLLIIYFFMLCLKKDRFLALAASLFVVGGYTIVIWHTVFYPELNIYGRAMYPYLISLAFFSYLILLHRALQSGSLKHSFYAGAVFGFLFYAAFFVWTFSLAFNFVLFCIFVLTRNRSSAKKILIVSGVGALLGAYNLFRLWSFVSSPAGEQFAYFSSAAFGHSPVFTKLGLAAVLLWSLYFALNRLLNKADENEVLLLALILAGWAALNQQVVSGRTIQLNHYYWYFVTPLSILVIIYIFWSWITNQKVKMVASVALAALVFLNTAAGQYKSALATWDERIYEQNYAPIINALNKDKESGVILSADDYLQSLFAIYTSHDLFWHGFSTYNDIPLERFEDALLVYAYLGKVSREEFADWVARSAIYGYIEGYNSGFDEYEYQRKLKSRDENLLPIRKKLISGLSAKYDRLLAIENSVSEVLNKYGVNYIVWNKQRNPEWDLSLLKNLKEVTSYNNIYLYSI